MRADEAVLHVEGFYLRVTVTETQDISVTELTFGVIMASTNVFYVFAVCRKFVLT
jgi:hypothetical protein